ANEAVLIHKFDDCLGAGQASVEYGLPLWIEGPDAKVGFRQDYLLYQLVGQSYGAIQALSMQHRASLLLGFSLHLCEQVPKVFALPQWLKESVLLHACGIAIASGNGLAEHGHRLVGVKPRLLRVFFVDDPDAQPHGTGGVEGIDGWIPSEVAELLGGLDGAGCIAGPGVAFDQGEKSIAEELPVS